MNDSLPEQVGALIRGAREQRRMTLTDLCAACGVAVSTLSTVERGRRAVTLDLVERVLAAMDLRLHVESEPMWEAIDLAIDEAEALSPSERVQRWAIDFTAMMTRFGDIDHLLDGAVAAAAQGAPVPVTAFEMAVPRDEDLLDRLVRALREMAAVRWCERWRAWGNASIDPREEEESPWWRCVHGDIRIRLIDDYHPRLWVDFAELPPPRMPLISMLGRPPMTPSTSARVPVVPLADIEAASGHNRRVLDRIRARRTAPPAIVNADTDQLIRRSHSS